MNRTVRALVLGMIAVLATVGVAAATTPSLASPTTLGRGTLAAGAKINTENLKLQVRTNLMLSLSRSRSCRTATSAGTATRGRSS